MARCVAWAWKARFGLKGVPRIKITVPNTVSAQPGENPGQKFTRWVVTWAPTAIGVLGAIAGASGGGEEVPVRGENGAGEPAADGGGLGEPGDEQAPGEVPPEAQGEQSPYKIIDDTTGSEQTADNAMRQQDAEAIEKATDDLDSIRKAQTQRFQQQHQFNNDDDWDEPLIPGINCD